MKQNMETHWHITYYCKYGAHGDVCLYPRASVIGQFSGQDVKSLILSRFRQLFVIFVQKFLKRVYRFVSRSYKSFIEIQLNIFIGSLKVLFI